MKKIYYLFITIILFICTNNIYAFNSFDNKLKLYDYAQVLTEKEEQKLKTKVDRYINSYNIDMAIVTVKYYEQQTLENYMNLFYTRHEFGKGVNKDGIIAVIDLKENNNTLGIKTYGRAINFYNEFEINDIITSVNEEKDYYEKISVFIDYANKYLKEDKVITSNNYTHSIDWFSLIIPSILIPTAIIFILIIKHRTVRKEEYANYYVKENSVIINTKEDKFITTQTKKERINKK